jgi:hypothetical protein
LSTTGKFHARARIGALSRSRPEDDPELVEEKRKLKALGLEEYIAKTLATAPPLTSEQRAKLAELLRPAR